MANHKSCEKKWRVNQRRHTENLRALGKCRSAMKAVKGALDKASGLESLKLVYKQLDRVSVKHRMHPNKVNRLKSRYAKIVNAMA